MPLPENRSRRIYDGRRRHLKKYLRFVLTALILFSLTLSSCGPGASSYGEIENAEVSEKAADESSLFSALECPFSDYRMTEGTSRMLLLSYKVPSSWKKSVSNSYSVRYDAPSSDSHFPGATFYIYMRYDVSADDDMQLRKGLSTIDSEIFSYDLEALPFSVSGSERYIHSYLGHDKTHTPSFSDDAMTLITEGVVKSSEASMSLVSTYFRWQGHIGMVSCMVPDKSSAAAVSMTEYIVSTLSYEEPSLTRDFEDYAFDGISLSLPSSFEKRSSGFIFDAPFDSDLSEAGMSIGLFRIDDSCLEATEGDFSERYGAPAAKALARPGSLYSYTFSAGSFGKYEGSAAGEISSYFGSCDILTSLDSEKLSSLPYGIGIPHLMDCYILELGGNYYLLAAMVPVQEGDIAERIEKVALMSIKED